MSTNGRVDQFVWASQRDLAGALVRPADLPAGWAAVPGARRALRALAAATRCPSFGVARDGRRATWTLRRLPDPRPAGVALRMASGPLVGDVVVLRRGDYLYGLSLIDGGVPDPGLERRLIAIARARLARLAN